MKDLDIIVLVVLFGVPLGLLVLGLFILVVGLFGVGVWEVIKGVLSLYTMERLT